MSADTQGQQMSNGEMYRQAGALLRELTDQELRVMLLWCRWKFPHLFPDAAPLTEQERNRAEYADTLGKAEQKAGGK